MLKTIKMSDVFLGPIDKGEPALAMWEGGATPIGRYSCQTAPHYRTVPTEWYG